MNAATIGKLLAGGLLALSLGGCMMAVRGAGGTVEEQTGKTLVREIDSKDLSLTLEAPPLSAGREARLILKLARLNEAIPVTGAVVTFIIEREGPTGEFTIVAQQEAEEIVNKGLYQLHYKFKEPGRYKITAGALAEGEEAAQAQTVSLTQEIGKTKKTSLWLILGAAALLAVKFLIL